VENTGNTVLAVHPDAVEIYRGRVSDPMDALAVDRRPGHRLWIYTNFHCNLACDYCCAASSPRVDRRIVSVDAFAGLVAEAVACGVHELYLTGGEPFLLPDLDVRVRDALRAFPVTILTNAMLWTGTRLAQLEALPRDGLTLQVSLDAATAAGHDRHRGEGSFVRAMHGIETAQRLGFRVRVAATLDPGDDDVAEAERDLDVLFDELGLDADQRLVRRVAQQGAANRGLVVSRTSLVPEVCVTAEGSWWHPVAVTDPAMRVRPAGSPLAESIDAIRDEFRAHRIANQVLASTFPCA
jgi:hypothetical protein